MNGDQHTFENAKKMRGMCFIFRLWPIPEEMWKK
jgi:hypothetical protein